MCGPSNCKKPSLGMEACCAWPGTSLQSHGCKSTAHFSDCWLYPHPSLLYCWSTPLIPHTPMWPNFKQSEDTSAHRNSSRSDIVGVTDKETRMCMDPGGNEPTMNMGEGGGSGPPEGGGKKWAVGTQRWRWADVHRMPEDIEDGLGMTSRHRHAQSMSHCIC